MGHCCLNALERSLKQDGGGLSLCHLALSSLEQHCALHSNMVTVKGRWADHSVKCLLSKSGNLICMPTPMRKLGEHMSNTMLGVLRQEDP